MSRRAPRLAVGIVAFVLTSITAQAAFAAWLDAGSGAGAARARTLALTGNAPTVGASGSDVTVSWPQNTFVSAFLGTYSGGGYRVRRYDTGGTLQTAQAACNTVVSGSAATLSCIEHNVPTGTWRYGVTPILSAWSGTESTRTQVVVDAPPALVSLEMFDNNGNGKIDQVKATFSETLATYTAGTTPWTLANVPSGGTLASVSVSGTIATLVITEGAGAANTAVGSFTVALATSATGIRDAAGNQSSFAATAPADAAGPVAVSITSVNVGSTAGKLETGDYLEVTFSEVLSPTWASPASVTVRVTGGNGSNDDKLDVPNLFSGALGMGSGAYISGNGTTADFASTLTLVNGGTAVRVTLGTCSGGCASLTTGGAGVFTFTPATAIVDSAGNAPAGSLATANTFRFF